MTEIMEMKIFYLGSFHCLIKNRAANLYGSPLLFKKTFRESPALALKPPRTWRSSRFIGINLLSPFLACAAWAVTYNCFCSFIVRVIVSIP